jgi:hypothetical protein
VLYEDQVEDQTAVATNLNAVLSGISFSMQEHLLKLQSHNFQQLVDLLGGSYF